MKCANEDCEREFEGKAVYILGGWWCPDCALEYMIDEFADLSRHNPAECLEKLARGLDYPMVEV